MSSPATMSFSDAAYQLAGSPGITKPVIFDAEHFCGNCHETKSTAPAKKILTSQFGSWEDIAMDPRGGRWLCLPCAWAYRDLKLRRISTLIEDGAMTHPTPTELRTGVLTGPIPSTTAVVVPVSGKRIVLPKGTWGALTFDGGVMQWRPRDRRLLGVMSMFRAMDVGEKELMADIMPGRVLADTPHHRHTELSEQWTLLDPLRKDKVRAPLFLMLSRENPS